MPVKWNSTEAFTRLLAAMVAAQDLKLDYRKIAEMYGEGTTYNSIEGRFRIIKKEAADLKAENDTGARPEAPARGAVSTTTTPKKPKKDKVVGSRVDKNKGTPSKKRDAAAAALKGIKEETDDSSNNSFLDLPGTEEEFAVAIEDGFAEYGDNGMDGMNMEAF